MQYNAYSCLKSKSGQEKKYHFYWSGHIQNRDSDQNRNIMMQVFK